MKSTDQVVAYLAYRIGQIYYHDRPNAYGKTAEGVELLLHTLHDIWAHAVGRSDELEDAWRAALKREDCGIGNFSARYLVDHPEADDEEAADYVVQHWRKISEALAVPIPHAQLEQDFAEHIFVKKKRFNW